MLSCLEGQQHIVYVCKGGELRSQKYFIISCFLFSKDEFLCKFKTLNGTNRYVWKLFILPEGKHPENIVLLLFTGRRWYLVRSTFDDSLALTISNEYGSDCSKKALNLFWFSNAWYWELVMQNLLCRLIVVHSIFKNLLCLIMMLTESVKGLIACFSPIKFSQIKGT